MHYVSKTPRRCPIGHVFCLGSLQIGSKGSRMLTLKVAPRGWQICRCPEVACLSMFSKPSLPRISLAGRYNGCYNGQIVEEAIEARDAVLVRPF